MHGYVAVPNIIFKQLRSHVHSTIASPFVYHDPQDHKLNNYSTSIPPFRDRKTFCSQVVASTLFVDELVAATKGTVRTYRIAS